MRKAGRPRKYKVALAKIGFNITKREKERLDNYASENTKSIADIFRDAVKPITRPDNKKERSA